MTKFLSQLIIFFVAALALILSIRGNFGNPTSQVINQEMWKDNGPFELSPERGRFALVYSLLEDKSFAFTLPIARFAAPDVGYTNGNYVSLFAPGVSYVVMPGYLIGKMLGVSQVGTYAMISLFALLNVYMIKKIAERFGSAQLPALLGGLVFLFATPAYTYGVTLYQHHISTLIILMSVWLLMKYNNFASLMVIWLLYGFSFIIDYPNLFMMLPVALFALGKFFVVTKDHAKVYVHFLFPRVLTLLTFILPVVALLLFNQLSYNNPFQLSGGVASPEAIDEYGNPVNDVAQKSKLSIDEPDFEAKQDISQFFYTRNMMNGLYQHTISMDRGMLLFTPVMIFGLLGFIVMYNKSEKTNEKYISLLVAVAGINILLYSMWGDPYGGWAFGSRYLIPLYAMFAIAIAFMLTLWRKNLLFVSVFFVIATYSIAVNTLGAITSSRNPPRVEAVELERLSNRREYYTFERNIQYVNDNVVKAFAYRSFAQNYLNSWQYYAIVFGINSVLFTTVLALASVQKNYEKNA